MNTKQNRIPFLLAGLIVCYLSVGIQNLCFADRLNFYDGSVINAKVTEISGDLIRYREGWFHEYSTRRMKLIDRLDMVTTRNGKQFVGEIHYIDGAKVELLLPSGRHTFWKVEVKEVQLGGAKAFPQPFNATTPTNIPAVTSGNTMTNDVNWNTAPQTERIDSEMEPRPMPSGEDTAPQWKPVDTNTSKPRVIFPE